MLCQEMQMSDVLFYVCVRVCNAVSLIGEANESV